MATSSAADLKTAMLRFTGNKPEATSKQMTKWFTDAKVLTKKNCSSNNLDIAFSKIKAKHKNAKNVITTAQVGDLIAEVAKAYSKDKNVSEDEANTKIKELLCATNPDYSSATKTSATGGVDGLTDASKYTGSHKERFDADGKGKGIDGREDRADGSGYVGNYKGEGSYDKK